MKIEGIPALVVGGASGLGAAAASALAARGARVSVLDRNAEAARAVAGQIGGLGLQCDVTSDVSAEAAVAAAREAHGAARILVNTAGVAIAGRIVTKSGPLPLDEFRRGIEVNLVGTFNMLRLAAAGMIGLPPLEDDERGVIINTASIAGYEGQIGQASYTASKAGIIGLTLQAAREFASVGIRVCTIAPGLFDTPMGAAVPDHIRDSLTATIPFPRRLGRPEEFGRQAINIVETVYLNGETLRLDAALRLSPR